MRPLIALLLCMRCAGQSPSDIANAEMAFARLASEKGTAAAFLATLAEGSVILQREPVDARAYYAKDSDTGLLMWRPTWVGISASDDLAYSTGPWEYRVAKDAAPLVQGHFLSIWAKQPDGTWKVAFDCGVPHGPRKEQENWGSFLPSAPPPKGEGVVSLKAADATLTDGSSIGRSLAFGAVVYRPRFMPLEGRSAVLDALADEPVRRFVPAGAVASKAQDLGYSWGTATTSQGDRSGYLHVWVRPGGVWRLLYELELPVPKKP